MRLASLEAAHEAGKADISVSRFPGGGDVLSNVNRWRSQAQLPPLDEAALKSSQQELTIGGHPSIYVEAIGAERAILAAITPDGDVKWFFKMDGPQAAIEAEREHFRQFLNSVQFTDGKPAAK
jgi:hypothetical protein